MFTFLEELEEIFAYFVGGECAVGHRARGVWCVDISILSVRRFGLFAAEWKNEKECILGDTFVL